ncbi:MAG: hypothetical protein WC915_01055 [archaeon]|jgi:hypothetical protein
MEGNAEFLILFIPFLIIGISTIYVAFTFNIEFIFKIILGIIGLVALAIDAFALLVQYINWKYYKE